MSKNGSNNSHMAAEIEGTSPNYLGGIALRLLAMLSLSIMFVIVKLLDQSGVHVLESLFWRQALVLPFLLVWIWRFAGFHTLRTQRIGSHMRRTAMGLTGMACNFLAMIFLPMAEATTINLSVPIFAVIFAAILLGEKIRWQRWSAVLLGFIGVLIVLDPSNSFADGFSGRHGLGTMIAITGAITTALISIAIRDLGRTENASTIVFYFSLMSMLPLGLALPFVYTSHSAEQWLLIAGLGLTGAVVQMSLTGALRLAPVSVVLPMDYSALLWAIALGWYIFGTVPAETTWIGAPIIIFSGLFIAWREHRRQVQRPKDITA
ncbi:DMT family transporter [Sphingopyxis yananensis]|uniref:DMT family transporter n=1 Tax=Sphingopyxis yananensis TaxID=2886687 RepID=UPI001D11B83C|nr:DMT family transporter [Sphingopyxis yananensis]MCC2603279.1 DMT family transporter [Sphingopyxis yananensis]